MEESTATVPEQLKNEQIVVSVLRKPACIVEYSVETSPAFAQAARKRAVKVVAKQVSLPGFRKGRAPDELVIKNFPKDVDKQWQEEIANEAIRECQKLTRIPMINRDAKVTFRMKSYTIDRGASLTLSFETEPTIPSVDAKNFDLKEVKRPEVNEEKVSETIRQTQLFFASWDQITDRPVQLGDFLLLDVDVIEELPATSLFSDTRFEVVEKSMAKWMFDLVLGKNKGDSVEGISVPDESASEEDKESLKPKKVRVHIKEIEKPTLPELTDEFATRLGSPSLEQMRATISKLLDSQADAHVQEALREQASTQLLEKYPFDLPVSLIERETHFRMKQLMADPDFQKYWESLSADDRRKMIGNLYQQSEKAVRMFYLCRKIIADAKIRISPEDLPKPPTTPLEVLVSPNSMPQQQSPEIQHAEAFSRLVLEKAEDWIIANASKSA